MPTLEWIGKDKVVNHHQAVPYRVLERKYSFDSDGIHEEDNGSKNMIIHGDNLEALKSLLPRYEGKVKCIYIDPPYNTGNEGWVYNDNVNDPKIKKWLGEVVGKEGDDLSRHDKWLCMMYPRLRLLQKLLSSNGVIFISIDDKELYNLKLLCDEIFGGSNFVATCIWQAGKKGDAKLISVSHEYVVIYAANKSQLLSDKTVWRREKQGLSEIFSQYNALREQYGENHAKISEAMKSWYKKLPNDSPSKAQKHFCHSDARGLYFPDNFAGPNDGRENRPRYDIIHPVTGMPCKKPATGWRWDEAHTQAALAENPPRIHFGPTHETIPCRKSYLHEVSTEPFNSVFYKDGRGASLLVDMMLGKGSFDFPKDHEILADLIGMVTSPGDIVLDSFAGSASTAHAVLKLNQQSGTRQFILVELMDYAESKTAERVRKAITGYTKGNKAVEGTGGDFSFYELGERLLDEDGRLNAEVDTEKIRSYIWYTEVREDLPTQGNGNPYFLGKHGGCAYYFYYEKDTVTTLNYDFLATIPERAESFVVYADRCALSEAEMQRFNLTYKKIPRDIVKL